jgi:hypothetical protein
MVEDMELLNWEDTFTHRTEQRIECPRVGFGFFAFRVLLLKKNGPPCKKFSAEHRQAEVANDSPRIAANI